MTPIAHKIARDLMLPLKDRTFVDHGGVAAKLFDCHFFELTAVHPMAIDLAENVGRIVGSDETAFLPAPKTWLEYKNPDGVRTAFLLEESRVSRQLLSLTEVFYNPHDGWFSSDIFEKDTLHLIDGPRFTSGGGKSALFVSEDHGAFPDGWHFDGFTPDNLIMAFLLFINTPKVIGRRQHMPHRGLERDLRRTIKLQGKFPLRAWTEIVLECTPPKDVSDLPEYEAHLTGAKCLHFCRAHLRVRLGRLEFVKSHWRGDASLGIKQTRYRVTPDKQALHSEATGRKGC